MSNKKTELTTHSGVIRSKISLFQAIALIVSGTIGAGILGIPYAVAKVGLLPGLIYIAIIGALMVALNLLIGDICQRTGKSYQLTGLAKEYFGKKGEALMGLLAFPTGIGVLTVYIIGVGESLQSILGGSEVSWATLFVVLSAIPLIMGIRSVKTVELVLSLGILLIVLVIGLFSAPDFQVANTLYFDNAYLFLPFGVVLFAFSGSAAVPEAYNLLKSQKYDFKNAVVAAGLVIALVYAIFATIVVGVTGQSTTEIATIGLGEVIGPMMLFFGNLFAVVAMGTSYLLTGLSLRHSFNWDLKIKDNISTLIVILVPAILYYSGVRSFIGLIDVIGGVFVSTQFILLVLIYLKAKKLKHLPKGAYKLHHTWWIVAILLALFTIGGLYSIFKMF